MINVVIDFNAQNNGSGSNYTPFMSALSQAISNGGDEIYFPPGIYKIKGSAPSVIPPVYKTGANKIKLYGKGAVIVCDTDTDVSGINGAGGGIALEGNDIVVEDLEFVGQIVPIGDTSYGYGRLLRITGNNNTVGRCNFKYGNGAAVDISGAYNRVTGNIFYKCNNYPVNGGDYGAIQIGAASEHLTISENYITDQYYSGICAFGNIAYVDITNNYIRSNSSSSQANHSMGIFLLQGSYNKIKITGNTIEKIDAEAIIFANAANSVSSDCIIANNIIRDCVYRSISLEQGQNGSFTSFLITGNHIENTANAPVFAAQIGVESLSDSIISNNRLVGYNTGTGTYSGRGIHLNNFCPRNQILYNSISYLDVGVYFFSPDGIMSDNLIFNCNLGIDINYCRGANVHGNLVKFCAVGINNGTDPAPQIYGNSITDCANRFSGSIVPELITHTGVASSGNYSSFFVSGTLSGGEATISFYNVFANDQFIVLPLNQSADVQGVLYISSVNVGAHSIKVRSTFATDSRSFIVLKLFAAG